MTLSWQPSLRQRLPLICALACRAVLASTPHAFTQLVDHFSSDSRHFQQRYYMDDAHFKGPGWPVFVILGGEWGITPEAGMMFPWVTNVLAKEYGAMVLQPEHRYYGTSLPFGETSFTNEHLRLLNSQQALADYAYFIRAQQSSRNCTGRGTLGYCPVLTIGGSYPGFLSALMRVRYPDVVDMAYASSAPMKFYSQDVDQYAYYTRVTQSAEASVPGCAAAVRSGFEVLDSYLLNATERDIVQTFSICEPLANGTAQNLRDNLLFLLEQTFANLNMHNYPPGKNTGIYATCIDFVSAQEKGDQALLQALERVLLGYTSDLASRRKRRHSSELSARADCFAVDNHVPAGAERTARCGDWSGCGTDRDGEMWDYQTCTFNVEQIGFGTPEQMFPARKWSLEWLVQHCAKRFAVTPQPTALNELWGFDEVGLKEQTSRILFTNGLKDGWSVGGYLENISQSRGLVAMNLPNGAHRSDLLPYAEEPAEVVDLRARVLKLIGSWLKEIELELTQTIRDTVVI